MSFRREPWGTTRAGEAVELFTLENAALRARFAGFGATLVALEVPDRRGERADVVLGFDTLAEYDSARNPHVGGIVGRCANRIAGARFELDGREYRLAANEGRNHLHGGPRGFDRQAWKLQMALEDGLLFHLTSPDGDEGYPGWLEVDAIYALGQGEARARTLMLSLRARASSPTVVNLTQHSYFNLAGGGTILDHELEIGASRYLVVDEELVPTGEIASVAGTPLDFRTPRRIGERIGELLTTPARGYDLCYVLDAPAMSAPAARLRDPASGRTLELRTSQPGLQLYTGNRLEGLLGKHGRPMPRFGGVCLETQGLSDAIHHATFPSPVVRPDQAYVERTAWIFSA